MPSPIKRREGPRGVRWAVQVPVGRKPDGSAAYRCQTFTRERDAKAFLAKIREELANGVSVLPTKATLREYVDEWLATAEAGKQVKANTLANYHNMLSTYILPELGDRLLANLTPVALEHQYAALCERGVAPSTIHTAHAALKSAIRRAVRHRQLPRDPTSGAKLPKMERTRPIQVLKPEQAAALLRAAQRDSLPYLFPVLAIALATGARPSEYLALTWPALNLKKGTLAIRQTLVRVAGRKAERKAERKGDWQLLSDTTKTAGSARQIKVTSRETEVLRQWKARQGELRLAAGDLWQDSARLVFTDEVGRPLSAAYLTRQVKRLLRAAGLPVVPAYALRHSAATALLIAGVHPKVVADRLGHASITQTLDTYSHVVKEIEGEAAEVLGRLFLDGMQDGYKTGQRDGSSARN